MNEDRCTCPHPSTCDYCSRMYPCRCEHCPHRSACPVTGPDGDNPIAPRHIRELRDSFDEADDPDLALACDRALGLDSFPDCTEDEARGIVETSIETCAAAYNARHAGKETP